MLFINKNTQKMKNAVDQQKIKKSVKYIIMHGWEVIDLSFEISSRITWQFINC